MNSRDCVLLIAYITSEGKGILFFLRYAPLQCLYAAASTLHPPPPPSRSPRRAVLASTYGAKNSYFRQNILTTPHNDYFYYGIRTAPKTIALPNTLTVP